MKKLQYSKTRRLQKGASLLEGIAYLGIAAIVVIGAIALLNTAFSSSNANDVNSQLSAIQTATRKLFMTTQGNYGAVGTDITPTLILAKGFPQTLSTSGGVVTTSWGGTVTTKTNATSTDEFDVTYTAVPPDVCVNALTSTTTGWEYVVGPGDKQQHQPPIDPPTAKLACGNSAGSVAWTSK